MLGGGTYQNYHSTLRVFVWEKVVSLYNFFFFFFPLSLSDKGDQVYSIEVLSGLTWTQGTSAVLKSNVATMSSPSLKLVLQMQKRTTFPRVFVMLY